MYVASNLATGTDMEKYQSQGMPRKASPLLAGSAAHAFIYCIDTIQVAHLPVLCGIRVVIFHGTPCVPVGGRHDLLAERAGLYLPLQSH